MYPYIVGLGCGWGGGGGLDDLGSALLNRSLAPLIFNTILLGFSIPAFFIAINSTRKYREPGKSDGLTTSPICNACSPLPKVFLVINLPSFISTRLVTSFIISCSILSLSLQRSSAILSNIDSPCLFVKAIKVPSLSNFSVYQQSWPPPGHSVYCGPVILAKLTSYTYA